MTSLIMSLSFVNQLFFHLQAGVWKNFWHLYNSGLSKSHSKPLPSYYWQQAEPQLCYFSWIWCSFPNCWQVFVIRTQKLIPCVSLQDIYLFDACRFICLISCLKACSVASGTGKGGEMGKVQRWKEGSTEHDTLDGIMKFVTGELPPGWLYLWAFVRSLWKGPIASDSCSSLGVQTSCNAENKLMPLRKINSKVFLVKQCPQSYCNRFL